MRQIALQPIPNQAFSTLLDDNQWDIAIKATNGVMSATIARNNVLLLSGFRTVAGQFLVPFPYQESGNFFFTTQNQDLPYYDKFGVSQFLIYISQTELDVLRAPPAFPITDAFFNPLGALPLRYKPQGY